MRMEEKIASEIKLADDECCIVFDFGCYFPYSNPEVLTFSFALGMEEYHDYKLNHRYPNKAYQTITKKYGRRVSKLGYPVVLKLNEQTPMILSVKFGIKEKVITSLFPLQTNMTKESPICGLTLHFVFEKREFKFSSFEKIIENDVRMGWRGHYWSNVPKDGDVIWLGTPQEIGKGSRTLSYDKVITPYACTFQDLML